MNTSRSFGARAAAVITTAALAFGLSLVAMTSAQADTVPTDPTSPTSPVTVAADGLPTAQIDGCPFRSRCPKAYDRCRVEAPELKEHRPGRFAACHLPEDQR